MNRPLRLAECSQPISWVFCVYFVGERCIIATRQQCCCNAFRIHSRSVRNVFILCMLHIRRVKVWFLSCKKGIFTLQKYGFCFLNVGLLQFVRNVIAICQQHFGNPFAAKWQSVRSRRGSIYRARIYVYTHEMENGYVRAVKRKHVFGNVWIRAR